MLGVAQTQRSPSPYCQTHVKQLLSPADNFFQPCRSRLSECGILCCSIQKPAQYPQCWRRIICVSELPPSSYARVCCLRTRALSPCRMPAPPNGIWPIPAGSLNSLRSSAMSVIRRWLPATDPATDPATHTGQCCLIRITNQSVHNFPELSAGC